MPPTSIFLLLWISLTSASPSHRQHFDSVDRPISLPHCVQLSSSGAEALRGSNDSQPHTLQKQFHIGLHDTVCFRLDPPPGKTNETHIEDRFAWLHSVTFAGLEHHHPIMEQYDFGIPEVQTDCICECDRTKELCSRANYGFTQCPVDGSEACYRTFHSDQPHEGCAAGSDPRLCCEVKFKPYQNRTYTAMKLDSPSTFVTLDYVAYYYFDWQWLKKYSKRIVMSIDGSTQHSTIDDLKKMSLTVSPLGGTSHALKEGMYFVERNESGLRWTIRGGYINEVGMNDPHALGWYRKDGNGHFFVNNGVAVMDEWHAAEALNCNAQKYKSNFNGVTKETFMSHGNFSLPPPLEQEYPWVERVAPGHGKVIVFLREATNLHLTLTATDAGELHFLHNKSCIGDFEGSIIVDDRSNRYLNLIVSDAAGKLNGILRADQNISSPIIHSFTVHIRAAEETDRSLIIPLPATVDAGRKMVCIGVDEIPNTTCHWMGYIEEPLEVEVKHNTWHLRTGHCPQCNQDSFFDHLVRIKDEVFKVAGNILDFIPIFIAVYLLVTMSSTLIIPVCYCCIRCMLKKLCGKRSKRSNVEEGKEKEEGPLLGKQGEGKRQAHAE